MKLLIIGGTVFLGRHLVEAALAGGHEVTTFSRGLHDATLFPEVEKLRGDRRADLGRLKGRRWDAVVDTCGYVPSAVTATARLLSDAVEHYTFISSQSVYTEMDRPGIDESYAVQELTPEQVEEAEAIEPKTDTIAVSYGELYGGLKALCERAAEREMLGRVFHVRAGLIVGPNDYSDRFTYWMRRVAAGGEVLAPGEPSRPVQLVDVRDLAAWILSMALRREAGVYNATGPDRVLSMGELLETARNASGSPARFTWVSEEFLTEAGVAPWSEVPLWLPEDEKRSVANFFSVDCRKAWSAGLKFRLLMETARDTIEWDAARGGELRAGLKPERERELLTAWHAQSEGRAAEAR